MKCPKCKQTRLPNLYYELEGLLVCEKCYHKSKDKKEKERKS